MHGHYCTPHSNIRTPAILAVRFYNNVFYSQELIQSSADRLAKLAAKWEEVRAPLTERYRSLKGDSENKESEANLLLEEIKLLRERMKEVADETRLKDDLYKQLVREWGCRKFSSVDEKFMESYKTSNY